MKKKRESSRRNLEFLNVYSFCQQPKGLSGMIQYIQLSVKYLSLVFLWIIQIQHNANLSNITTGLLLKNRENQLREQLIFSYFLYFFMNPAVLPKLLRIGNVTLQGVSLLFRRSYLSRRTMVLLMQGRTQVTYFQRTAMLRNNIIRKPCCRQFSTVAEDNDSNTYLYIFGVIASLGIAGGIFYYSSSLQVRLQISS